MRKLFLSFLLALAISHVSFAKGVGFTQEDRERLIRLEATLQTFMEQTNKRFEEMREDMNKRFEQMDKRFEEMREDMNKRFEQLRDEMNKRFEQVDKRFEEVNRRFEEVNRRFEEVNKRFEEQLHLFKWIAGIFTAMVAGFVSLLIWDRRTAVRAAIKEHESELDKKFRISDLPKLIEALKEKAKSDKELAEILRNFHLL
jgi:rubrerythrin